MHNSVGHWCRDGKTNTESPKQETVENALVGYGKFAMSEKQIVFLRPKNF